MLERLRIYATGRGGVLVSTHPPKEGEKVTFACELHGEFRLRVQDALYKRAQWCPGCKFKRLRDLYRTPYFAVKSEVESHGWQMVTPEAEYESSRHSVMACGNGHRVRGKLFSLRKGQGCRACRQGRGEAITRAVFERVYDEPF